MTQRNQRFRDGDPLARRSGEVLFYLWDPLGVADEPAARDEYDSYLPHVCSLLRAGDDGRGVIAYLASAERDAMGLEPDPERLSSVADLLVRLASFLGEAPIREEEFWLRLEHRLSRELDGNEGWRRLGLWCDALAPTAFHLDPGRPSIHGDAWIGLGDRNQQRWGFQLLLPPGEWTRDSIAWKRLIPAEDVTGWLWVDPDARRLEMAPGSAVPDQDAEQLGGHG